MKSKAIIILTFASFLLITQATSLSLSCPTPTPESTSRAKALFARIRADLQPIEAQLLSHPYLSALQNGEIDRSKLYIVAAEQFYIAMSDTRSLGTMLSRYGHIASGAFFEPIFQGGPPAIAAVQKMAAAMGKCKGDLEAYEPSGKAQGYAANMALFTHYGDDAHVATAFAINFEAWGKMCASVAKSLKEVYGFTETDVEFFTNCGQEVPGFEDVAATVVERALAKGGDERLMRRAARLFQEYELMFWDAVWELSS